MSRSLSFDLLHKDIQRWVWAQNWSELRDIQEQSIEPILNADCDIVISASTAAGKTEAAFLPACSRIAEMRPDGIGILYVSPLKALINDQYRRLEGLCESLDLLVTPWHGDVSLALKRQQKKEPNGIVLITPESLESLLLNQSSWCIQAFSNVSHIIIDEFHAFIGTERGCQLQSILHRFEFMLDRIIPRIALSATLGDMEMVADFLRPHPKSFPCKIIESNASHSDLKIQLRGYRNRETEDDKSPTAFEMVVEDSYKILRGKSNLVFANSRARTEELAAALSDLCEANGVPNEFFPHHGSLSKEIREGLEKRLLEGKLPTSAVCTMTLELGIDIGNVDSIAQVTAPHSVASLRQRLGRSGRRNNAAVLRLFILEDELTTRSHLLDRLRLETVQCIAMVNLLLKKWCEPPSERQYHLSTLVQQTLSVIGQYGAARADQLWALLCGTGGGPFSLVDKTLYASLLRCLGEQNLITQTHDGSLTLGVMGERLVSNFKFYTAFKTPEEYRLECNGRTIGTVPIDKPLVIGQLIIFAGKRWEVISVDAERRVVNLKYAKGGRPPKFGGVGQMIHGSIRQEMLRVYMQKDIPVYLDKAAKESLLEGIEAFHSLGLSNTHALQIGNTTHVLPWLSDQLTNTITILLRQKGLAADCFGGIIDIRECSQDSFFEAIKDILKEPTPSSEQLASLVQDTIVEKYDHILPLEMRSKDYGRKFFNVNGAIAWMSKQQTSISNQQIDSENSS